MRENIAEERLRRFAAVDRLRPLGFYPVGGWRFMKDNVTYDLSAANLDMIDTIVDQGQFVVPRED